MSNRTDCFRVLALASCLAALSACKFPYPPDVGDDGSAACTPSTATCTGSTLTVCDANGNPTSETCAFGCFTSGDRCADLDPSNGLAQYLDQARTAAPIVMANMDVDTTAVTVNGQPPPFSTIVVRSTPVDIMVFIAGSLDTGRLFAHGDRALAIVADGDVHVGTEIAVGIAASVVDIGSGDAAGASPASDPACTAARGAFDATGYGGAGGGGYGSPGGRGGAGGIAQGGAPGAVVGNDMIVPLRGGCPGAHASGTPPTTTAPHGGAGGGALQISTRGAIVLEPGAMLTALGRAGVGVARGEPCPYGNGDPVPCDAGSGGGAGGAILLEASSLIVPSTAAIVANGGGGMCGWSGAATAGKAAEMPALGLACGQLNGVGNGGNGAAGVVGATDGGAGAISGGGGGGGVGRIRINLPARVTFDPAPPIVSPMPSLGMAATR